LVKDKKERKQINEIIQHPWITNAAKTLLTTELFTKIANRIAAFKKTSVFQAAVLSFLAGVSSDQVHLKETDDAFKELDVNQDGKITRDNFVKIMKERLPHLKKYDWEKYFSYVDTKENGFIEYN